MCTVIFHWEVPECLNTPHAQKKLLSRWDFTCKAFGITKIYCVSENDVRINDAEIEFKLFKTLDDAIAASSGELVYLEENGTPLKLFVHPTKAVYIFGSDYAELESDNSITINANIPLHAEIACGIVLSHRFNQ